MTCFQFIFYCYLVVVTCLFCFQSGKSLKLTVAAKAACNIRSDGQWRARGHLIRSGRQSGMKAVTTKAGTAASVPSTSEESSARRCLRSHLKMSSTGGLPIVERRQRYKTFCLPSSATDSGSETANPVLATSATVNATEPLCVQTGAKPVAASLATFSGQRPHSQSFSIKTSRKSPIADCVFNRLHPHNFRR